MKQERSDWHYVAESIEKIIIYNFKVWREIFVSIYKFEFPLHAFMVWYILITGLFAYYPDSNLFEMAGLGDIYSKAPNLIFWSTYLGLLIVFVYGLMIKKVNTADKMKKSLTMAFLNAKIKSGTGMLPHLIGDYKHDSDSRKMVLKSNGIPLQTFKANVKDLETSFGIFIDEIEADTRGGTTTIYYSDLPMPKKLIYSAEDVKGSLSFIVGMTRTKLIHHSFLKSPHMLLAGASDNGKSTFVRQIVTSLLLNNKNIEFELIDLKGGLEAQVFDRIKDVNIIEDQAGVTICLNDINGELDRRMALLKKHGCKDIAAYQKKMKAEHEGKSSTMQGQVLKRKFIFADEAGEIFLGGAGQDIKEVQLNRKIFSRIARIGRACGYHLVIATQRPDVKALDPQVKANLGAIMSFALPNIASSMTVLGNKKAAELPEVKGRALWKIGRRFVEVQTPFLDDDIALGLLKDKIKPEVKVEASEAERETPKKSSDDYDRA